jgi:transcription elongation GreA/GreB family factor
MSEEATTRPTIETVLERINALGQLMNEGFAAVRTRLNQMDERLEQMDTRLDRTQAMVHEMRADFRDFRAQFKQPA